MKMLSGTLVEDTNLLALSVVIGRAELKLRKDHPELAVELVNALVVAVSKANKIMISSYPEGKSDVR